MSGESLQGGLQNSGLSRFVGNVNPYMPPSYTPKRYMPPSLDFGGGMGGGSGGGPINTGPIMGGSMSDRGGDGYSSPSSSGGGFSGFGGNMGPGGSSALGNLGLSGMGMGRAGFGVGGPLGGLLGMAAGYASELGRANDPTQPGSYGAINGLDAMSDAYGGGSGGFGGGGYSDSDAGSTGAGGDTGSSPGMGGDGTGSGGDTGDGWARGGWVTKDRLRGRNPKGPDDGYGALDVGEFVVPKNVAQQLGGK